MYKILIVDDDKEICDLIQKSLINEGIDSDYCYSGSEALKK